MKRFFKRIIRKIGYRFIRILVPCIIALSLILSCGITASADNISVPSYEIMGSAYLNGSHERMSDGRILSTLPEQDINLDFNFENSNFYTVVNEEINISFDYFSGFWVLNNLGSYGYAYVTEITVKGYDENNVIRTFSTDVYGSTSIPGGDQTGNLNFKFRAPYTLPQITSITIIFYFPGGNYGSSWNSAQATVSFAITSNFNWFVGKSYTGADNKNYNLYENVENQLLNSQKNYLSDGADFVSGLSGMPTSGMLNGLAVVSQFMTRFLAISEFGSIFRISLALGFFAFIVGMGVFIADRTEFGYRGKHSKGESKGGKHSK